jgi:hypothetical protein
MANAFGFKTKTDYSDVTLARQRQTAQTALQLKDAMKNVSSTIIEKRIAKKYDDPYSIEAMKERQVAYAGIDPTRSEQARKYINDAMTQQRLNQAQAFQEKTFDATQQYRADTLDLDRKRLKATSDLAKTREEREIERLNIAKETAKTAQRKEKERLEEKETLEKLQGVLPNFPTLTSSASNDVRELNAYVSELAPLTEKYTDTKSRNVLRELRKTALNTVKERRKVRSDFLSDEKQYLAPRVRAYENMKQIDELAQQAFNPSANQPALLTNLQTRLARDVESGRLTESDIARAFGESRQDIGTSVSDFLAKKFSGKISDTVAANVKALIKSKLEETYKDAKQQFEFVEERHPEAQGLLGSYKQKLSRGVGFLETKSVTVDGVDIVIERQKDGTYREVL